MITRKDALRTTVPKLIAAGIEGAERDAQLLLAHVLDVTPSQLLIDPDVMLDAAQMGAFDLALKERIARRPISQILGKRDFWKHAFIVTSDVLDPRPETEQLVEAALAGPEPKRLLDLGTGTGCIAISILADFTSARGVATDISQKALDVAQKNAVAIGVADRLELVQSDWFSSLEGRFDLIVSNPPYITQAEMETLAPEVALWEPHLALTPGSDGLSPYRSIANSLPKFLEKGGRAIFEAGLLQIDPIIAIFQNHGFQSIEAYSDLTGRRRGVIVHAI